MIGDLHFLRPAWLVLLLGVPWLGWWLATRRGGGSGWQRYLDPSLLPYLLVRSGPGGAPTRAGTLVPMLVLACVVVALAGPAWRQLPQPLYRSGHALVVAVDLSRSMAATDLQPNRLARARQEISDLLAARTDGETALVVYGPDAFVASPLTDDAATIQAMLPALATDLLPRQGSNASTAMAHARDLLAQAGLATGHVLLVTDAVDEKAERRAAALRAAGIAVSVLAVGTPDGAPIELPDGGLLKDAAGNIVIPRTDTAALAAVADAGGGAYAAVSVDDSDTARLLARFDTAATSTSTRTSINSDLWREEGPWLLLVALPFAALAFRRGLLVFAAVALLPIPQPADAADWAGLWQRPDQRGAAQLRAGDAERAAELFEDREWQAAARYRAGDFAGSAGLLDGIRTPRALYNRGNALAFAGDVAGAIEAYEKALELDPGHDDARYNLEQLRKAMPPQQGQGDGESGDGESGDGNDSSGSDGEQGEASSGSDGERPQPQQGDESADPSRSNAGGENGDADGSQEAAGNRGDRGGADANDSPGDDDRAGQDQAAGDAEAAREHFAAGEREPVDADDGDAGDEPAAAAMTPGPGEQSESEREARQATEQWLRRIPEDPGGLLRRKFLMQYQRQAESREVPEEPW